MSEETQEMAAAPAAEAPKQEVHIPAPTAHDDFDWSVDKRNVVSYDQKQHDEYDVLYGSTLRTLEDHQIVLGSVVAITTTDVVFNIGFKSDGLVPLSEFRDQEVPTIGEEYDVYVVSKEDKKGHLLLSRKNAKLLKAWEKIVTAASTGEVVTGKVDIRHVKVDEIIEVEILDGSDTEVDAEELIEE